MKVNLQWEESQNSGAPITKYTVYQRIVNDGNTSHEWAKVQDITSVSVREVAVDLEITNLWSLPQTNVAKVKKKWKRSTESQYWEVLQIVVKFAFIRLFKKALIRFCRSYSLIIVNNSVFDFSFSIASIGTILVWFNLIHFPCKHSVKTQREQQGLVG